MIYKLVYFSYILSCPNPIEVLGDSTAPGFAYSISDKTETRTVRISRNKSGIGVSARTTVESGAAQVVISPINEIANPCNTMKINSDMFFASDAILSLLASHCLRGDLLFPRLRMARPAVATLMRSNLHKALEEKCPVIKNELQLLKKLISIGT